MQYTSSIKLEAGGGGGSRGIPLDTAPGSCQFPVDGGVYFPAMSARGEEITYRVLFCKICFGEMML